MAMAGEEVVMDDDPPALVKRLARSLEDGFHTGYSSANALLLYWEENDLGFEAENDEFAKFLASECGFNTVRFPIPSERPEQALQKALSDFVFEKALPNSLAMIYYGGHGDADDQTQASVWAA